ncbi:hypothetical protein B7P43_G09708 [Cryptotermes secundus]|uniref:Uncharacterized protein n=1 Tax=Cryptotermes secundus TaxID=105785 RepID=A0A2J7PVM7_9NEOP|nr:hypothetical protein B7P43_G09708 [Cryptotermes secundus]
MAHKLNIVLSQSVSSIKKCNMFFKTLNSFSYFFSASSKRMHCLDQEVKKRFPKVAPTRWNYNSRLVETICEYKFELNTMFQSIIENPDNWDNETYFAARGFLSVLQELNFNFLLAVFKDLFSVTTVLFDILQTKSNDISLCIRKVTEGKEDIAKKRENFENIFSETSSNEEIDEPQSKRLCLGNVGDVKECFRKLYYEIFDNVVNQIELRFQNLEKLKFLELINPSCSKAYEKTFPGIPFLSLKTAYGQHFNFPRLRSELNVFYFNEDLNIQNIATSKNYTHRQCTTPADKVM